MIAIISLSTMARLFFETAKRLKKNTNNTIFFKKRNENFLKTFFYREKKSKEDKNCKRGDGTREVLCKRIVRKLITTVMNEKLTLKPKAGFIRDPLPGS